MLSPLVAAPTLHHEAIDWATRASANGGTISTTTIRAVSEFCRAVDTAGIRDRFARLSLFAGGNLSGALVPLYCSFSYGGTLIGNATDTNSNFVSADFSETGATGGLKGNGTNKWLGTGVGTNAIPSLLDSHLSLSATSMEAGVSGVFRPFMGTFSGAAASAFFLENASTAYRYPGIGSFQPTIVGFNATEAHLIGSRTSSTLITGYRSGAQVATNTVAAGNVRVATQIAIFTRGDSQAVLTAARFRMYSIGTGLTATQAAAFSAAVIAFNAALGR